MAFRIVILTKIKKQFGKKIKKKNAWRHMLQAFFYPKISTGQRFSNLQEYPENKLLK
jgi:hypothetical protein